MRYSSDIKTYTLKAEEELRLELLASAAVSVTLLSGNCELFGTELLQDNEYKFSVSDSKFALFTWYGCEIRITGVPQSVYVASETPQISFINSHAALEHRRQTAKQTHSFGPRALIVGQTDSGKSTLQRILLSYATRAGHCPIAVDLDVGQNSLTVSGAIAATSVEQPIDIESYIHNDKTLAIKSPLAFYFGHTSPAPALELYRRLIGSLGPTIDRRCKSVSEARIGGCVINTCGWIDGAGYELLIHAAVSLRVDVIFVIGSERLHAQITADSRIDKEKVEVVKLVKSGGVIMHESSVRTAASNASIKQYFYGLNNSLTPHQKTVKFDSLNVYRFGVKSPAPDSVLPIGTKRLIDPNAMHKVNCSLDLLHMVCGVSFAQSATADELIGSPVAGFVYISAVDVHKKTLTLLCPAPGPLPSNNLITGSVKWRDI